MEQVKSYKCPCCSSALIFSGSTQKMHCDSCGNDYEPETIKQIEEADASAQAQSKYEWDKYTPREFTMNNAQFAVCVCPSCGAEITADATLGATVCPYCDNTTILKDKFEGMLMPDYIIPFRVEKGSALTRLMDAAKKKLLIPNAFKSESKLKELKGVYVPFWMFDCKADADITYNAQRVTAWSDSKYNYTKTDFFRLFRKGNAEFANIPVDASTKADDSYMDALEPFDYNDAVNFDASYLSGYLADKYDVSVEDSIDRANRRIRTSMESMLRRDTVGYSSVQTANASVRFDNGKVRYALLPVWMLNILYKGELYRFAINGQTGKTIGNYPVDKGKLTLLGAIVFAAAAAVSFGVYYLAKKWGLF